MNVKIGDSVISCFGPAKIVGMELTPGPGFKDGDPISVIGIESIKANKVVFDLSDGHWVYSDQIRVINNVSVSRL